MLGSAEVSVIPSPAHSPVSSKTRRKSKMLGSAEASVIPSPVHSPVSSKTRRKSKLLGVVNTPNNVAGKDIPNQSGIKNPVLKSMGKDTPKSSKKTKK